MHIDKHIAVLGNHPGDFSLKPCTLCGHVYITDKHHFCTRLEDTTLYNMVTGKYTDYQGKRLICEEQRGGTTKNHCGITGKFYTPK